MHSQESFQQAYQNLNSAQKQAVDQIEGPVMVIAGAGTGKTQILAVRIANILQQSHANPQNILCLTFTEPAVTAMRKRLIKIIGSTAYQIKICTFHSFCNEIIRENLELFLFKKDFEQLDDLEKFKLLQEVVNLLGVESPLRPKNDPSFYLKEVANAIRKLKQENFTPEDFQSQLATFAQDQELLQAAFAPFIQLRQPTEAELTAFQNELQNQQAANYGSLTVKQLNYFQKALEQYNSAATGEKKIDGPKRTALKNLVKNMLTENSNNLPKQLDLAKAYQLYQEKMREKGRYDYEDMIYFVTQELSRNPQLLRQYQERFQYILVDEYQDTNNSQNQTVSLLGNFDQNPNIFVVGDDDQAIYRFQGASVENIINFFNQYASDLALVTLTENYRSQQNILDAAGRLIQNNQSRLASQQRSIDKNLISRAAGLPLQPLQVKIYQNTDQENQGIVEAIQNLLQTGVPAHEIAVLYRENKQANALSEALTKANIPFFNNAGENVLQDYQINNFLRLLKVISKPNQNDLLAMVLFLDFLNLQSADLLKLFHSFYIQGFERQQASLFFFLKDQTQLEKLDLQDPAAISRFCQQLLDWQEDSQNKNLPSFFEQVLKESGFLQHLEQLPDKLPALNRLKALFKDLKKYASINHQLTLTDYLSDLELRQQHDLAIGTPALFSDHQAVQLMTVHKSKGLEFSHVFLYQATDKKWCSTVDRSKIRFPQGFLKSFILDQTQEAIEDARRLFYVALTRAKEQVYLSYANFHQEQEKTRENEPVRFLAELPKELLTEEVIASANQEEALSEMQNYFTPASPDWYDKISPLYLKKLAEKHTISPTSLNNYLTCPRKFLLSNLIHLPQAKSVSSAMGSAIHYALEQTIKKFNRTLIRPSVEFAIMEFKVALQKEILNHQEYVEREKIGKIILEKYLSIHLPLLEPTTISEYNFGSERLMLDQQIPITGKIDKIEIIGPQQVKVTDFKTGNVEKGLQKSKHGQDYWRQLVFYKILGDLSQRFKFQCGGQITQSSIEFLEAEKKSGQILNHTLNLRQEDIEEVKQSIRFSHQQILQLQFDKLSAPGEPCDFCPFYQLCWPNSSAA